MIIAIATSRKESILKNIEISWEEFLSIVSNTKRTAETVEGYKKLPNNQQDDIKDVGGFVAGSLKDGQRKKGFVEYRSMLTLDMDYAKHDVWEYIRQSYDFTCCIYSTHKHSSQKPRLRLIIPLSRNVTPDEYTAIARMVASDIDIEQFDDTTYEPTRLMYWPSTSIDGEFVFERKEGVILDADKVLSRYDDWRDSSQWPVSSRQTTVVNRRILKQEDPLEKKSFIGAFCRSYSINEAIEKFLPHVYKQSLIKDRYDYIPADSTAGVVVYEDKFAYSHHATDKACGKLCNAFDLVRIHKFGELDANVGDSTPTHKLPSFRAMADLCNTDEKVKIELITEKIEGREKKAEVTDNNWVVQLELNKNDEIKDTLSNIVLIMRYDENLRGIAYNQHCDSIDVKGELPWSQVKHGWSDSDMSSLKVYFDRKYNIWSPTKIKEALVSVATERAYHPIKDYLEMLPQWDGVRRLDTLLVDYLGAEDNEYTRAVIRKTLAAAVARIYNPGTKFDNVLILNGPQGIGKSTFFAKLGQKWFSDSLTLTDMRDKTAAEKLQGYWLLELGELAGLRKTDSETVKSFVSRTDDKYRASYGINVESHPRQCIIVGSTNNESGFLRDVTGNRRFWPVRVSGNSEKNVWDLKEIDQIWAEALVVYNSGEQLFLTDKESEMAKLEQADAMESDDREGLVREYLDRLLPEKWNEMSIYDRRNFLSAESRAVGTVRRDVVCPMEIWCECFEKDRANIRRMDSYEINSIMAKIEGWKPYDKSKSGTKRFAIYNKQRAYIRTE